MQLLVGFYCDPNAARTNEFLQCVQRNSSNAFIDQITVFLEDAWEPQTAARRFDALSHKKVRLIPHGRRLTFNFLFDYARQNHAGMDVCVANTDIYFDETLGLLESEPLEGQLFCLTRWEAREDGSLQLFDFPLSQDAWIFEAPLPRINADFFLGKPSCDNRLAYEAERAGLRLINPSRTIRAVHLHRSGVRRYSQRERYSGPQRGVPLSFFSSTDILNHSMRPLLDSFPSHRGIKVEHLLEAECRKIAGVLRPYLGDDLPPKLRRELLVALRARTAERIPPGDENLASVGFREPMGYTLARMEPGVSTHNNHPRPLTSIPPALEGLQFTQVVSGHSTSVDIEFRTRGRIFVLAARGWDGYAPAAAFLDDAGWRQPCEPLRTSEGTVFDPWFLCADAGERVTIPVQVMLASTELVRMD